MSYGIVDTELYVGDMRFGLNAGGAHLIGAKQMGDELPQVVREVDGGQAVGLV